MKEKQKFDDGGTMLTLRELAEKYKINYMTLYMRAKMGAKTVEELTATRKRGRPSIPKTEEVKQ